jgi:pyroglutamyl-peptidase
MKKTTSQRRARTVLLTGFDPFGGETRNPSWEAVRRLRGKRIGGARVAAVQLPTQFEASRKKLLAAIKRVRPDVVMLVGQAGWRASICLERVAINVIDARIPDNAKRQPVDVPVIESGPVAYWSTLPIKAMQAMLRKAGIACEISNSAGTYVCNAVFYALMHHIATQAPHLRGGFIHIPFIPEQVENKPGAASVGLGHAIQALICSVKLVALGDLKVL